MQLADVEEVGHTLCSAGLIQFSLCRLFDPKHFLLPLLGSRSPLDVAIGVNGRVWINTKEPRHTIAVARCIEAADPDGGGMDELAVEKFLGTLEI